MKRHRNGPGILIVLQILAREIAAGFGQRENSRAIAHAQRLLDSHVMLPLQDLQQFIDQAVLEAEEARQIPSHHFAAEIEKLQDQLFDQGQGYAGIFQGFGLRRNDSFLGRSREFVFPRFRLDQRGSGWNLDLNTAAQGRA